MGDLMIKMLMLRMSYLILLLRLGWLIPSRWQRRVPGVANKSHDFYHLVVMVVAVQAPVQAADLETTTTTSRTLVLVSGKDANSCQQR